jgi:hypothetical protein
VKPNKQIYIDFIIESLSNGEVSFENVFKRILTKFNLSRPTFAKYWKLANEQHSEAMQKLKEVKDAVLVEQTKKEAKRLYLDRAQRMEIAFQIALKGEYDSDKLKALDYLAKMDGDYKPAKTAQTDSEGNDIPVLEQLILAARGVKRKEEVEN